MIYEAPSGTTFGEKYREVFKKSSPAKKEKAGKERIGEMLNRFMISA